MDLSQTIIPRSDQLNADDLISCRLAPQDANRVYYQTQRSMPELLFADWVKAPEEAEELRTVVCQAVGN